MRSMVGAVLDTEEAARERVREVLQRYPGSQRAFGEEIGLDPTKLSKSLTGVRRFTAAELTRIAGIGSVTVNWLVNGSDEAYAGVVAPQRTAVRPAPAGDSRYQQILDATWRLIAERGYHAVRVSDVAEACGTSTATIHYHFPGRDDLLTEALRVSVKQAFDRQVAELHSIEDAHERLLRLIEVAVPTPGALLLEWSIWLQVWNESALHPELRGLHSDAYSRFHDTVAGIIADGQRQGLFVATDPEDLTITFTALIDGLGIQVLTRRPGRTAEHMRRVLVDFVEREIVRRSE